MEDKFLKAKKLALMDMRKGLRDKTHSGMGEDLKKAKMMKVTVAAPDAEGLQEGISKAEQILRAKFGMPESDEGSTESSDEDALLGEQESEDMEGCPACEGLGCPVCEE